MPGIFVRGGSAHIQGHRHHPPWSLLRNCSHSISGKKYNLPERVGERKREINHKIENELHSTSVEERSTSPAVVRSPVGLRSQNALLGALLSGGSSGERLSQALRFRDHFLCV